MKDERCMRTCEGVKELGKWEVAVIGQLEIRDV